MSRILLFFYWILPTEAAHRVASNIDTDALYKYAYYYEYDALKQQRWFRFQLLFKCLAERLKYLAERFKYLARKLIFLANGKSARTSFIDTNMTYK